MKSKEEPEVVNVGSIKVMAFKSMDELLERVFDSKNQVVPGIAIAINPEKVIKCTENLGAQNAVLSASIPYADGIGVVRLLERKLKKKLVRIPGVDLWYEIMVLAGKWQSRVYLVGSTEETVDKCALQLKTELNVNVVGAYSGYFDDSCEVIARIKEAKPEIITVAMGSPKQELFIELCRKEGISAFFMGVGGTYDVYVGNVKRAPNFLIKFNLEWLYRLFSEPFRWKRQSKLIKYIYLYLFNRL